MINWNIEQCIVDMQGIKHWEIGFPYRAPRVNFNPTTLSEIVRGLTYQRIRYKEADIFINGTQLRKHYTVHELLNIINAIPLDNILEITIEYI